MDDGETPDEPPRDRGIWRRIEGLRADFEIHVRGAEQWDDGRWLSVVLAGRFGGLVTSDRVAIAERGDAGSGCVVVRVDAPDEAARDAVVKDGETYLRQGLRG